MLLGKSELFQLFLVYLSAATQAWIASKHRSGIVWYDEKLGKNMQIQRNILHIQVNSFDIFLNPSYSLGYDGPITWNRVAQKSLRFFLRLQ